MKVSINGEAKEAADGTTVGALLEAMKVDARYIAVAVNMEFVPRSEHQTKTIKEGDEVEIVSPQSGG